MKLRYASIRVETVMTERRMQCKASLSIDLTIMTANLKKVAECISMAVIVISR